VVQSSRTPTPKKESRRENHGFPEPMAPLKKGGDQQKIILLEEVKDSLERARTGVLGGRAESKGRKNTIQPSYGKSPEGPKGEVGSWGNVR